MKVETILKYQELIYKILSKYKYDKYYQDDYFQEGVMALISAYDTFNENNNTSFCTYAYNCIDNKFKDIFKKRKFDEISLNSKVKDNLYLLDIIPSKEEDILMKLIIKETKHELQDIIYHKIKDKDRFIICSLYGIGTRKTTQKKLANTLSCIQSCIAKNHNRILNLIRKSLEY